MRHRVLPVVILVILLSTAPASALPSQPPADISEAVISQTLRGSTPFFIENRGQLDDRVHYYFRGRNLSVFVTEDGLTLLTVPAQVESRPGLASPIGFREEAQAPQADRQGFAVRLDFVGARRHVRPRPEGPRGPLVNLLTGGRANWHTNIPATATLVYTELWPGIDLALVGKANRINYEFRVKPGADPGRIRLRYRGGETPRLQPSGDLVVDTPLGTLRDPSPFAFQERRGEKVAVPSRFELSASDGTFGFALASYDRAKPLIIDPAILVYASYLGGAGDDEGTAIAVDASGAAYITGVTSSDEASFPTGTGFQSIRGADATYSGGGYDAFVAKVLPSGTKLAYVTYVGGNGRDVPSGIAVDSSGAAYVTGHTNSADQFPTLGGPDTSFNGGANDVFVFKLDPSGTALVYSGFVGGNNDDRESGIAIDPSRSAYVTGLTYSNQDTFPTGTGFGLLPGADQTHNGDGDAFVVKVSPDGGRLLYASYIGGNNFDNGYAVGVDEARNVYVGGNTGSDETSFPDGDGVGGIPGPDTTYNGGAFDAFVVKLNAAGTSFSYVAFVGGAGGSERDERYATGLAVDPEGNAWIAGGRASAEDTFPTGQGFGSIPGFDRTSNGGPDGYVVKINSAGTAFDYATYIGGSGNDEAVRVAIDSSGNAYVIGRTSSTQSTFPDGDGFGGIPGPDTTYNGGPHDAFVVKINGNGTGLSYATYLGGPAGDGLYDELGSGIAVDKRGNAYVTGYTSSDSGFPAGSGFGHLRGFDQTHNGGGLDAFVVKISKDHSRDDDD